MFVLGDSYLLLVNPERNTNNLEISMILCYNDDT
jgi:hypothetical protein